MLVGYISTGQCNIDPSNRKAPCAMEWREWNNEMRTRNSLKFKSFFRGNASVKKGFDGIVTFSKMIGNCSFPSSSNHCKGNFPIAIATLFGNHFAMVRWTGRRGYIYRVMGIETNWLTTCVSVRVFIMYPWPVCNLVDARSVRCQICETTSQVGGLG